MLNNEPPKIPIYDYTDEQLTSSASYYDNKFQKYTSWKYYIFLIPTLLFPPLMILIIVYVVFILKIVSKRNIVFKEMNRRQAIKN